MTIFLDTGILGLLTHKKLSDEVQGCARWLWDIIRAGHDVVICEINDYEIRRALIRINSTYSLTELDRLISILIYSPISTPIMRRAAAIWARARNEGRSMAPPEALDCDAILLAHVQEFSVSNPPAVIVTTDVSDLSRFADARLWQKVSP
jgi:predicted nucleic acid-binding protein